MLKGKVSGLYGEIGRIICENNIYNFNCNIVNGYVSNGCEVEFELSGEMVKVVYGTNSTKSSEPVKTEPVPEPVKTEPVPEPVKVEPVPEPVKVEPKKRQNISKKLLDNDDREFLTEEK